MQGAAAREGPGARAVVGIRRTYSLRVALRLCDSVGVPYVVSSGDDGLASTAVLLTRSDTPMLWTDPRDVDEDYAMLTFDGNCRPVKFESPRELVTYLRRYAYAHLDASPVGVCRVLSYRP